MVYLFAIMLQLASCTNIVEGEIHLIPKGYEGPVIIVFDQQNGVPEKYENGSRVYEIPNDGVLRTQFKPQEEGYIPMEKLKYYYYDSNGRNEITYLPTTNEVKDSITTYIFTKQLAKGNIRYLIGKLSNAEVHYEALQKKITEVFPPNVMGK